MKNKYGGPCWYCDEWVTPQAGELFKNSDDEWKVRHPDCHPKNSASAAQGETKLIFWREIMGQIETRNTKGICSNAPECGCCMITNARPECNGQKDNPW